MNVLNFPSSSSIFRSLCICAALLAANGVQAQVTVKDAWVRATVPQQKATGAFMELNAVKDTRLVSASSPRTHSVEVHEMKMEGDIMKMRAMPVLDLPAGKKVDLKPGGFHVMLMDLKAPLVKDSTVPMTLLFKNAQGVRSKLELKLPVSAVAPGTVAGGPPAAHKH